MRRGRYATTCCACALLAFLGPPRGAAHEPSGTRSGYVSSVSEIRPAVLGLQASILGAQERLLVRNWSGKVVIILGRGRRPLFRLDERGVFQFDGERWRNLRAGTSFSWHSPHRLVRICAAGRGASSARQVALHPGVDGAGNGRREAVRHPWPARLRAAAGSGRKSRLDAADRTGARGAADRGRSGSPPPATAGSLTAPTVRRRGPDSSARWRRSCPCS
jgi:hypothetical protein